VLVDPPWQEKVLKVFYEENLGIRASKAGTEDGTIIYQTGSMMVIDWKSCCPILKDCKSQGVSTVEVCSTLYHAQYQALLSLIQPGAIFARDYSQLRPGACHCREIIVYESELCETCCSVP
jgi:hypothetical protein